MVKNNKEYKITSLSNCEAVRKVPGMYIGNTSDGTGYFHLFTEVLDNSIDEYFAGFCNKIKVILHKDCSISVDDNGRGIPVYYDTSKNMTALELALVNLHAGGKFDKDNYKISSGLHGVGISVVNYLSNRFKVIVYRNGKEYSMTLQKGVKVKDFEEKKSKRKENGTFIRFIPDTEIFDGIITFDTKKIKERLKNLSFLCLGLEFEFINENTNEKIIFSGDEGLSGFVKELSKEPLLDTPISFSQEVDDVNVDVSFQWFNSSNEEEISYYFTNNIKNDDGGTHSAGFRSGLTRTLNTFISNSDLPKTLKINLSGSDIHEGLVSIVSIRHPDAKYSSQTKNRLVSEDARSIVDGVVSDEFMKFLENNSILSKKIVTRCVNNYKAREAAKKAREAVRKNVLNTSIGVLPGKLADCSCKDPKSTELFIVEGASAGGCWISSTKLNTCDGRNLSFKQLLEEQNNGIQNYCYTIDNGDIKIAPIKNVRKTKSNTKVIKIILDNGCKEICTPNHKLMLSNGKYVEAKNSLNKSLMPLYIRLSSVEKDFLKGYEMFWASSRNKWEFTHVLADNFNIENRLYNKEKNQQRDFNKLNNIVKIEKNEHIKFMKEIYDKYGSIDNYDKESSKNLLKKKIFVDRFFEGDEERMMDAIIHYNHKVVKIIELEEKMDVYDLEVPGTHNFALSSGIFVHNSAKMGRNREYQAILPLRGKVLNVEKSEFQKMVKNEELTNLISAIGVGFGKSFDINKLRYNKIIIFTDSDVDGSHIRTLLLTFFYRQMPQLIKDGNIYIARPPLFRVSYRNKSKYLRDDRELKEFIRTNKINRESKGFKVQRFKGLGEMNPEDLWKTSMDPNTREVSQVIIEDVLEAEKVFMTLMGTQVDVRKDFIIKNYNLADLDI